MIKLYKLLIVDDNQTHIDCVKDYIDWDVLNFTEIMTASNGEEAMSIYERFCPDLIITDVVMPLCDGLELVKRIRSIDKKVHIIFMSCHDDFEYVRHALDSKITAYILKPIEPDTLKETVLNVVEDIEHMERVTNAERAAKEILPLAKESILYRYLYQEKPDISKELLGYANLEKIEQAIVVKYIMLNHEKADFGPYALLDTIYEAFDDFETNAITENPNIVIVMISSQEKDSDFLTKVTETLQRHLDDVSHKYNLELALGISNVHDSMQHTHTMLTQAAHALEGTYNLKPNDMFFYEDLEKSEATVQADYDIYSLRHDLSELINSCDENALDNFMDKYYPQNAKPNQDSTKALCFTTITTLRLLMAERNADINELFESPDIIWSKLNKFDTIKDTYHWLKNILSACCEFVSEIEKKNKHKLIKDIINYIDEHYMDITSVNQLAADLFISAGYAKNMFKKHTGQTIFDYLVDKRISEAKKILADPTVKVYEVSRLVGYTSRSHFADTFKRKTGMTPKEYQQR